MQATEEGCVCVNGVDQIEVCLRAEDSRTVEDSDLLRVNNEDFLQRYSVHVCTLQLVARKKNCKLNAYRGCTRSVAEKKKTKWSVLEGGEGFPCSEGFAWCYYSIN